MMNDQVLAIADHVGEVEKWQPFSTVTRETPLNSGRDSWLGGLHAISVLSDRHNLNKLPSVDS